MRRHPRAYRFDGWQLNLATRGLATGDGRQVPLTNGEFSLLVALLGSAQRVLTRDQLLSLSRLYNDDVFDRCVEMAAAGVQQWQTRMR